MFEAVTSRAEEMDIVIKAAAVADFRPSSVSARKIKKKDISDAGIQLERTHDILAWLGEHRREGQFLCGFAMETEDLVENAKEKLTSKNVNLICANSLSTRGAGFAGDTNIVTLITKDRSKVLPMLSKEETSDRILDEIMKLRK
jgi:phosphopantothenoylcysteine decarboxylase/phosphopantothenate--cysteine ligase